MNLTDIAEKYIDAINNHNPSALKSLMTGNHTVSFPDGGSKSGIDASTRGWQEFFGTYKDYKLSIDRKAESNGVVTMSGRATCLVDKVAGPTSVTISFVSGKVASITF